MVMQSNKSGLAVALLAYIEKLRRVCFWVHLAFRTETLPTPSWVNIHYLPFPQLSQMANGYGVIAGSRARLTCIQYVMSRYQSHCALCPL